MEEEEDEEGEEEEDEEGQEFGMLRAVGGELSSVRIPDDDDDDDDEEREEPWCRSDSDVSFPLSAFSALSW